MFVMESGPPVDRLPSSPRASYSSSLEGGGGGGGRARRRRLIANYLTVLINQSERHIVQRWQMLRNRAAALPPGNQIQIVRI